MRTPGTMNIFVCWSKPKKGEGINRRYGRNEAMPKRKVTQQLNAYYAFDHDELRLLAGNLLKSGPIPLDQIDTVHTHTHYIPSYVVSTFDIVRIALHYYYCDWCVQKIYRQMMLILIPW